MVENTASTLEQELGKRAAAQAGARTAAAHALGGAAANPLGDLQALARINQHLARALRGQFEPLFRRPVKVIAEPIEIRRFDAWLQARGPGLSSTTPVSMAPLSGQAMLVLDGGLVFQLVDLYFGGAGSPPNPLPAEFTPTAEAMIGRLAAGTVERLAAAWGALAELEFRAGRSEVNPSMLGTIDGEDRVVLTRFRLELGPDRHVPLDILYPAAALKPIAPILSSKAQARRGGEDPAWLSGLTRAVMQVKLPVRSVLAEPVIPLAQLMALKPGDVIPISFGPEIPLLVSGTRFARGAVGAANGRAAIRIQRLEPLEDEDQR